MDAAETQMWQYQNHNPYSDRAPEKFPLGKSLTANPNTFSKLQYRVDATRRAYQRALQALQDLPTAPAPTPVVEPAVAPSPSPSPEITSPQIGFVLPTPAAAPPQLPPAPLLPPVKRDTPFSVTRFGARQPRATL
jgi:hypothetical protein